LDWGKEGVTKGERTHGGVAPSYIKPMRGGWSDCRRRKTEMGENRGGLNMCVGGCLCTALPGFQIPATSYSASFFDTTPNIDPLQFSIFQRNRYTFTLLEIVWRRI
jgi:hypothetical protein